MPVIKALVLSLAITTPFEGRAQSLGGQLREQANPATIQQAYSNTQARKAAFANRKSRACVFNQEDSAPCVDDHHTEILPPYPAAFYADGLRRRYGGWGETNYSWAPENRVEGGSANLVNILRAAKSHTALSCDDGACRVAVMTSKPEGRTLAICGAYGLGDGLGPPVNCSLVAAQIGSKWWIATVDYIVFTMYRLEPTDTFDISGLPRSVILATLDRAFSLSPLVMKDRQVKSDRIMALAPKRFSRILEGGWFEWPQILVEVDGQYEVRVSLDLLVNKQNTSDPADWHLPTDQQKDAYRMAIERTISGALSTICIDPVWEGSRNLTCMKLRTEDGTIVARPTRGNDRGNGPRVKLRARP